MGRNPHWTKLTDGVRPRTCYRRGEVHHEWRLHVDDDLDGPETGRYIQRCRICGLVRPWESFRVKDFRRLNEKRGVKMPPPGYVPRRGGDPDAADYVPPTSGGSGGDDWVTMNDYYAVRRKAKRRRAQRES